MSTNIVAWSVPLNPEPWAMGTIQVIAHRGRRAFPKVSPDKTMSAYQKALEEELEELGVYELPGPYYAVRFTFSRQRVQYKDKAGRTQTRNWADVTNMQKATEDAMQAGAIANDRDVIRIESLLASTQTPTTRPWLVIEVRHSLESFHPRDTFICAADERFSPEGKAAYNEMLSRELGFQDIQNNTWTP